MQFNPSATTPTSEPFRDVWAAEGSTRAIVDAGGKRTTFVYDAQSHTVIQFPRGSRATLAWCPSQMTTTPARLSQFAAHIELRATSEPASTERQAGQFLAHPESQRQLRGMVIAVARSRPKRRRWLNDVIQQANLHLFNDLRRGKAVFAGDDPDQFARWFSGASRYAVVDAIKFCLRAYAGLLLTVADTVDPAAVDPAELAMFRELGQLAAEEIGRIREAKLREVMSDLRDGRSTRDSAKRLGISKSVADRMRQRGCQLIADKLGE